MADSNIYAPVAIKASLPVYHLCTRDVSWLLASDEFRWIADAAVSFIKNPAKYSHVPILKQGNNRFVFRMNIASRRSKRPSVVVKSFPLTGLRNRLYRYRRYGPREAANLLEAGRKNIPVPRIYAYGQIASRRFVDCTMIMMEDLGGHRSVGEMLAFASTNEARQITLLRRTGALFVSLYRGGCNHIDLNPESVRVGESEEFDRLIDFHYAAFLEKPSLRVLMFNLAYFGNAVSDIVSDEILHRWARWVLSELGVGDHERWISTYEQFRRRRLSRRRRLAIR